MLSRARICCRQHGLLLRRQLHTSLPLLQQAFDSAAARTHLETEQARNAAEMARTADATPLSGKPTARVTALADTILSLSVPEVAMLCEVMRVRLDFPPDLVLTKSDGKSLRGGAAGDAAGGAAGGAAAAGKGAEAAAAAAKAPEAAAAAVVRGWRAWGGAVGGVGKGGAFVRWRAFGGFFTHSHPPLPSGGHQACFFQTGKQD